jgi:hypothetical protein
MDSKQRRRPTTPEEEGIELHPDAWERFERAAGKFVKGMKDHPAAKPTGGDRSPGKGRAGHAAARKSR